MHSILICWNCSLVHFRVFKRSFVVENKHHKEIQKEYTLHDLQKIFIQGQNATKQNLTNYKKQFIQNYQKKYAPDWHKIPFYEQKSFYLQLPRNMQRP